MLDSLCFLRKHSVGYRLCAQVDFKNTLSSAVMKCEETWDRISCIALSWIRAHFHKLVSMAFRGRNEGPVAVHAKPRLWFGNQTLV